MSRYSVRKPTHNKESRAAERVAKMLTEDMSIDLERVGYYLVRNMPRIIYFRLETMFLSAQEESDILVAEIEKQKGRGLPNHGTIR